MQLIKLDATDSTNGYLKGLLRTQNVEDFTVVVTSNQKKGRGQLGRSWITEPGKNLTISILKHFEALNISEQFILNIASSMAVYHTLKHYAIPDLQVKWPNDIMSGDKKICGILVENMVKGQGITSSVIGIGLNVNQTNFEDTLRATSMQLRLGKELDIDQVMDMLIKEMAISFENFEARSVLEAKELYIAKLFRCNMESRFMGFDKNEFRGSIRGISDSGLLLVELKNGRQKEFRHNEIRLLY